METIGLTKEEVLDRIDKGLVNYDTSVKTKTISQIIFGNIFTLFNLLNFGLGLAILLVGSYKNLLFLGVVFCNTFISIIQEIRSKMAIDRLSLIASRQVCVIREGKKEKIKLDEVVLDDLLCLQIGNQVVTDAKILSGSVEVNESYITGESDSIVKGKGDIILSGSFIVSGSCKAKVIHVGEDNYTYKISKDAKYIKRVRSEIMNSLNKIIKWISFSILPIGGFLFYHQLGIDGNTFQGAVVATVAAIIGMIPEGLVLLTSTVLAVSVLRLSRKNILVQELYCIETLARVDTICLDKTGTLTEGEQEVLDVIPFKEDVSIDLILNNLCCNLSETSSTMQAICKKYQKEANWKVKKMISFSSERKYSALDFEEYGSYYIGAPDILIPDKEKRKNMESYFQKYRVLMVGHTKDLDEKIPSSMEVICLILLKDKIRKSAIQTLEYFRNQKVDIKVISGDNIDSVKRIAKEVGITGEGIDATTLDSKDMEEAVSKYSIFGRVTPIQKKELIQALKKKHTVAFVGDGVNDVLALKESDISIALPSGSEAARNVSEIVLLDSSFETLPDVVYEGRRTINNVERSASLFLCKTMYSLFLAVIFLFLNFNYPFVPIQLTLMSIFTIGVPAFFLALEPNRERVKGSFLVNVLSKSFPTSLTIVCNIFIVRLFGLFFSLSGEDISTLSVIITGFTAFMLLIRISKPFNWYRLLLVTVMILCFGIGAILFRELFSLSILTPFLLSILGILMVISLLLYEVNTLLFEWIVQKKPKTFKV